VPPAVLNTPDKIGTNIKLELIGIVRKWPLYFCRLYPVGKKYFKNMNFIYPQNIFSALKSVRMAIGFLCFWAFQKPAFG
jgi:hypothetical protein